MSTQSLVGPSDQGYFGHPNGLERDWPIKAHGSRQRACM